MARKNHKIIELAKKYIAHLRDNGILVEQAYLYGSYVSGKAHKDSDIDIVVVSSQFTKSLFDDSVKIAKLRRTIDLRISPRAYHTDNFTEDDIIPAEAIRHGIRIA